MPPDDGLSGLIAMKEMKGLPMHEWVGYLEKLPEKKVGQVLRQMDWESLYEALLNNDVDTIKLLDMMPCEVKLKVFQRDYLEKLHVYRACLVALMAG